MRIYFDRFDKKCVLSHFILTHSHTDHSYIQKSFPYPIHCSPLTFDLLKHRYKQLTPTLVEGNVYLDKTKIYVFHNSHAPDSVGIFVYHTGMLYWGEGRFVYLPKVLTALKNKIIYTVIHDRPQDVSYTLNDSVLALYHKIQSASIHTILLRNYAQFLLLQPLRRFFKFELVPCTLTPKGIACELFTRCFKLLDWSTDSTVVVQIAKGMNGVCVLKESGYLIISGHRPVECDNVLLYSSHASYDETSTMITTILEHNDRL